MPAQRVDSRRSRRSLVGLLLPALLAAAGLTVSTGTVSGAARTASSACSSSPGVKPLIRGLVDRGTAPPAAGLDASSINVPWGDLQTGPDSPLVPYNPIDQAIAAGGCTPLRIRVLTGVSTPAWVLALTGGGVPVTDPDNQTPGMAGQFWRDEYETLYNDLEAKLAAAYDPDPDVAEFVVSRCALFYPEPDIIGTSSASNDVALLDAGYSEPADQTCQQEEIDTAGADWPDTRIGVSFNPYQVLTGTATDYTTGVDEAYTEQMMAYCRHTLGSRCVLENDSIRDPISGLTSAYAQMYAAMTGASGPIYLTVNNLDVDVPLGAPLAFQTAVAGKIGDFWGTLEWAKENHASSVELPLDGTYPTSGTTAPWQTLGEVAQWFGDVPTITTGAVTAVQGTPTSGLAVAQVTLDELAAEDTIAGYGDVGSVPFDTVSASITWPTGVAQAGLVSIAGSSPVTSAVCGAERWCDVTVYSGGYTFPEEPVTGTFASVTLTIATGAIAYTPDDGVDIAGAASVTVTVPALELSSLTVTPARSAPTAKLTAGFVDLDPLGVAADYTVQIKWGDGTSTSVPATISGSGFATSATHRYRHLGTDTVTITITDTGGASVSGHAPVTVR
jgi:hypothetical protein